jgi:L-lactate dehydrogenase complex protein LldE
MPGAVSLVDSKGVGRGKLPRRGQGIKIGLVLWPEKDKLSGPRLPLIGAFPKSMRVALFLPCFNDALFPETGKATVRILERLGVEVVFPTTQTCCGQIHFNTGYRKEARALMRGFLHTFESFEAIVAPSASCVAMVREQYPELAEEGKDQSLASAVGDVASRTFELTEFLVEQLGMEDVGASFPHTVTFHPTCHSIRSIDVGDYPLRLLRKVEGLELTPLSGATECCGFGGTFAVKNPDTSLAMMDDKIESVLESGAEVLTAVDNSCLMHLAGGMKRKGLLSEGVGKGRVQVMHLARILASTHEKTS